MLQVYQACPSQRLALSSLRAAAASDDSPLKLQQSSAIVNYFSPAASLMRLMRFESSSR